MGRIRRIWCGDIALPRVFWIYGIVGAVTAKLFLNFAFYLLALSGFVSILYLIIILSVLAVAYQVLVSVGIWHSAGRYPGAKLWVVLARLTALVSFLSVFNGVWPILANDSNDSSRNSANAVNTLHLDPGYPLAGFWKNDCSERFGLLVEPSNEEGKYSVSFCGPSGCFKPGTYRPNTTIVGDAHYRILDNNSMEVQTKIGFDRYIRCQ